MQFKARETTAFYLPSLPNVQNPALYPDPDRLVLIIPTELERSYFRSFFNTTEFNHPLGAERGHQTVGVAKP